MNHRGLEGSGRRGPRASPRPRPVLPDKIRQTNRTYRKGFFFIAGQVYLLCSLVTPGFSRCRTSGSAEAAVSIRFSATYRNTKCFGPRGKLFSIRSILKAHSSLPEGSPFCDIRLKRLDTRLASKQGAEANSFPNSTFSDSARFQSRLLRSPILSLHHLVA